MKRFIHIIALGIVYSLVLIALNFAHERGVLGSAVSHLDSSGSYDLQDAPNPTPPYPPPGE